MIARTVKIGLIVFFFSFSQAARAGYYTSIDNLVEFKWFRDYAEFEKQRKLLGFIADTDDKYDSPMRQRYFLLEALGRDGIPNLKTWQQKLNYGAVLIRRGKAYEATQILEPLTREQPENFLVWTQLATANFLSGNADFRAKAGDCMERALQLWPENMKSVDRDMQKFLEKSRLETDFDLDQFKEIEKYFLRLVKYRLRESRFAQAKKPLPETVDPIFLDEDHRDEKKPVSYLGDSGAFEVGRIARAENKKLPKNAIEIVEQLLIWMPTDQRLLWLLAEVFNAAAMDFPEGDKRNDMIRSTGLIYDQLDSFQNPPSFAPAIKGRREMLAKAIAALPPPRELDVIGAGLDKDKDLPPAPGLSSTEWWRLLGVGFLTGAAVGMFALWQFQEMRRRRQARASNA